MRNARRRGRGAQAQAHIDKLKALLSPARAVQSNPIQQIRKFPKLRGLVAPGPGASHTHILLARDLRTAHSLAPGQGVTERRCAARAASWNRTTGGMGADRI